MLVFSPRSFCPKSILDRHISELDASRAGSRVHKGAFMVTDRRNGSAEEKMGASLWSLWQVWREASRRALQMGRTDDAAAGPLRARRPGRADGRAGGRTGVSLLWLPESRDLRQLQAFPHMGVVGTAKPKEQQHAGAHRG